MRRGGGLLPRAGRLGLGDAGGAESKEQRRARGAHQRRRNGAVPQLREARQSGGPAGIRAQLEVDVYFHSSLLRQGQASRCPVIRSSTRSGEVSGARIPLTGSISVSSITNWPLIAACST